MKDISESRLRLDPGCPHDLGARYDGHGTNFAVFSEHAAQVYLCLFSTDGRNEIQRIPLPERSGSVWHGYVPGLKPGALYGYRADGVYAPEAGQRFNVNKLLLDPYAQELRGTFTADSTLFGYQTDAPEADLSFDARDSASVLPRSVVSDPAMFRPDAIPLNRGWDDTVIYEVHVKGLTQSNQSIPANLRGTFDGLSSDAVLEHLTRLGVTAIELMPVQAMFDEPALTARGLSNYWGYNTIGFFTPASRYLGPAGVSGFRAMVERFHSAGIEVILDVVYNHTGEGDHLGPTLSFRGLDNASYYRLLEGQPRYYVNDTGCGNTLNLGQPFVLRMVLDSLRFWVQVMGVDGFRFDLATTLCREAHGFDPSGRFLDALRQDPVLRNAKLIAEPWDIGPGGYQLGEFPAGFAEWNDTFRDTTRRFWRGDGHSAQDLGSALLGSAGSFDRGGRRSWASINFAASHDGFTLADVTQYAERHNEANGEGNRDGHHCNFSDNFGIEGPSEDPKITAARNRRVRNLLATVFLSQGTPMLRSGDELGQSKHGNNNAYCQDNDVSWIDWETADADLIEFVASLIRFRQAHPAVRQTRFLHGAARPADGLPDVEWLDFDGGALNWRDPGLNSLCLLLAGSAECAPGTEDVAPVLIAFNREAQDLALTLPTQRHGRWVRRLDTASEAQRDGLEGQPIANVAPNSVAVFVLTESEGTL